MKKFIIAVLAVLLMVPAAFAQSSYKIRSGDVLQIEIVEDGTLNRRALVAPDGRIAFPLVGSVKAAGLTVDQVRQNLTSQLASNFATPPSVFVALASVAKRRARTPRAPATISVYALGEVASPGAKEVKPGTTLLQFLSQTGGFTKFAATKRVQVRRTNASGVERIFTFNYAAMERGGAITGFGALLDGDVIVVPQRRLFE